ncbi:hypothetical protein [Agromyces sp. NPDC049794]|uniref:DivIVA domain-containing protein n=1 Tax=unclassified Agromyces TaxID=2639701 RepID=UPI0033EB3C8F
MTQNGTDPDGLAPTPGTRPENALADAVGSLPVAQPVSFTMKMRGGAYDRLEVDRFMGELSQSIAQVREAVAGAEQELAALRAENTKLRESGIPADEEEITAGAVGLLTQAQQIADKAVADAERYARDLVLTARNQYREILERAENSAGQATATLASHQGPAVPEIEYVRTYAQVAQIQLRSVLDALTEQVDRLGGLPQPAPEPVEELETDDDPIGEPEWEPSISVQPAAQPS